MDERPSQTYYCQCKGCSNGHNSAFDDAPEEWWSSKGYTIPKSCKDCRAWRKQQITEVIQCISCGRPWRITKQYKITYHMKTGAYRKSDKCRRCEQGNKPTKSVVGRYPQPPRLNGGVSPQALSLVPYNELSNYRKVHYGKHVADHPFSEIGQLRPNGELVTATKLVGANATSEEFYEAGYRVAFLTDENTYQYHCGNRIFKVRPCGIHYEHVEVTIFTNQPNENGQYELLTSYDEVTIAEAEWYIDQGRWQ